MKLKVGLSLILILLALFLVGPFLTGEGDAINMAERLLSPSLSHPFGTDSLGRDVLSRTLVGGRISYAVGFISAFLCTTLSLVLGLAACGNHWIDLAVLRVCDVLKAFPTTLISILLMVAFGGGAGSLVLVLTLVNIPQTARLVRSLAGDVLKKEFTTARRSMGLGKWAILFTTVPRHLVGPLSVNAAFIFSSSVIAEAALSFIGAGFDAGTASWGTILAEGRTLIHQAWWMTVFPSAFIFLSVLALNLIADSRSGK